MGNVALGESGKYILADLARLPFKDKSFDGVLASHCLHHIDKDLQADVLGELYRVTRPRKNILVFYSSRHNLISLIHGIPKALIPFANPPLNLLGLSLSLGFPYLKRRKKQANSNPDPYPELYSHPLNPMRLAKGFESAEVSCLMTLTRYDTETLRALHLLKIVIPPLDFLERRFPHLMAYIGKYTCIRIMRLD